MSNIPSELKYTKSHEWVRDEGDGCVTVGISDHAQEQLGDLVFVELPQPGAQFRAGDECAVVESVKAASDVYSPVTGEIVEVNTELADGPEDSLHALLGHLDLGRLAQGQGAHQVGLGAVDGQHLAYGVGFLGQAVDAPAHGRGEPAGQLHPRQLRGDDPGATVTPEHPLLDEVAGQLSAEERAAPGLVEHPPCKPGEVGHYKNVFLFITPQESKNFPVIRVKKIKATPAESLVALS